MRSDFLALINAFFSPGTAPPSFKLNLNGLFDRNVLIYIELEGVETIQ